MIVGICGIGNSGASAVVDYLRGYRGINIFDKYEFQILHQPDGINDLKYHLTQNRERIAVNAALHRFIKSQKNGLFANQMRHELGEKYDLWWKNYIHDLVYIKWKGESSNYDPMDVSKRPQNIYLRIGLNRIEALVRKMNPRFHFTPYMEKMFSIMDTEQFDNITKLHLIKLFDMMDFPSSKITVLDMLFSSTNLTQGIEFFDNARVILVDRDPRDIFVSARVHPEDSRFMPNDDAQLFVEYYKMIHECINTSDRCLVIQYEDMIYKYTDTTSKINSFLGLDSIPDSEFQFFDPLYSIKYTHRVNEYNKAEKEIKYIESHLPQHLFDFTNAIKPDNDPVFLERYSKKQLQYEGLKMR